MSTNPTTVPKLDNTSPTAAASLTPIQTPVQTAIPTPIPTPSPQMNDTGVVNYNGLEYLLNVNQLVIRQKIELLEVLTGFETQNRYDILNNSNEKLFFAKEDTTCCNRWCCGPNRSFDIRITDNTNRQVLHLSRPLRCSSCLCFCCLHHMKIESPPGELIGEVIQEWSCLQPLFRVIGPKGGSLFKIIGPICTVSCFCQDVEFNVFTYSDSNGIPIAKISKKWSGIVREAFTDADFFGVVFPMDLDVKCKAILLAATFLIDYIYFEQ